MPQIQKGGISGFCTGSYFYDLGGAHSKYRSKNIEEFALRMVDIGMNRVNLASTNSVQSIERGYLEQIGFREVFRTGNPGAELFVHCVDNVTLQAGLAPYIAIRQKKLEEEQARKRKLEEERQEKIRKEAEAKKKLEEEATKKLMASARKITSTEDVTIEWVRKTYNEYPDVSVQLIFNTLFRFTQMPDWQREYDDAAILLSINSRLARRRKNAQAKK